MGLRKSIRVAGLIVAMIALNGSLDAQGRGQYHWEYLGDAHVDGRVDHDKITISGDRWFRAIQFSVDGGAVRFLRVIVHFDNGANQEVVIPNRIGPGRRSRVIELARDERKLHSVEFWYEKMRWRTRPHVELWGSQ
ncbi:MAG TPA: hypothetical protein VJX67_18530 [Blastocatellia bacterium]|nr:hypothetical protein [Blastocatellia bacterium]